MGRGGGVEGTYEQFVPALRPVKTEETVSKTTVKNSRTSNVKEVGTPPVRSNLCKYSANCCFKSFAEQSHKDGVRKATAEEQLDSKTIHPAMRAQLHLPPLNLSWAL